MAKFNWINTPIIRGEISYDISVDKRICTVGLWADGKMLQCSETVEDPAVGRTDPAVRDIAAHALGKKALAAVLKKLIPILER